MAKKYVDHRIMVGSHPKIIEAHKITGILSRTRLPVLIEGKHGTGKKLIAFILHQMSGAEKPFVVINCATILPMLLEREFFGVEGSITPESEFLLKGKLRCADGGTVCLEEIAYLPAAFQGKLLRVLQDKKFVPFGSMKAVPLTARIVATSVYNMEMLVRQGKFREDLFFTLAASKLTLPSLRDRKEDIPSLVNYFITKFNHELETEISAVTDEALEMLMNYSWPGNVKELATVLNWAINAARRNILTKEHIQEALSLSDECETVPGSQIISYDDIERKSATRFLKY